MKKTKYIALLCLLSLGLKPLSAAEPSKTAQDYLERLSLLLKKTEPLKDLTEKLNSFKGRIAEIYSNLSDSGQTNFVYELNNIVKKNNKESSLQAIELIEKLLDNTNILILKTANQQLNKTVDKSSKNFLKVINLIDDLGDLIKDQNKPPSKMYPDSNLKAPYEKKFLDAASDVDKQIDNVKTLDELETIKHDWSVQQAFLRSILYPGAGLNTTLLGDKNFSETTEQRNIEIESRIEEKRKILENNQNQESIVQQPQEQQVLAVQQPIEEEKENRNEVPAVKKESSKLEYRQAKKANLEKELKKLQP
jgi:hypothetical protein